MVPEATSSTRYGLDIYVVVIEISWCGPCPSGYQFQKYCHRVTGSGGHWFRWSMVPVVTGSGGHWFQD